MAQIRPYRPGDFDDLYRICLMTAAGGEDASGRYRDPKLVGHVFAAPYALFSAESVLVAEDGEGVGGYIVGTPDTRRFEALLDAEWWPGLRSVYPDPTGTPRAGWSRDQFMSRLIHHPIRAPDDIVGGYPSHLHVNLLPRLQGRGVGRRLIGRWLGLMRDMGSPGAHLAVGSANRRALRFYLACGFSELERPPPRAEPIWFAMKLTLP